MKSHELIQLTEMDRTALHTHVQRDDVLAFFNEYVSLGGKDVLETYINRLSSFFDITLEPFTGGDLKKPDGSYWESSSHAFYFWSEQYDWPEQFDFAQSEPNNYFQSVDNIEPYT